MHTEPPTAAKNGVTRRIHTCGDGPDDIIPLANIYIVVDDNNELRVHELPQERPDAHHYALGMSRVLLLHTHDRESVGAAFGRQVEIHDLRKLFLRARKPFDLGYSSHFLRRLPASNHRRERQFVNDRP